MLTPASPPADWAADALGETTLGDPRRRARVLSLVRALTAQPGASVSQAYHGAWAPTVAAYRLLANPHLDPAEVLASVGAATGRRAAAQSLLLLVQDTTEMRPTSPQRCQGLGPLANPEAQGWWLHTMLAITPDGLPLGLLGQQIWTRDAGAPPSRPERYRTPIEGKESARWLQSVLTAQRHLDPAQQTIVVADREADIFELYTLLTLHGHDFVLRAAQDRRIAEPPGRLRAAGRAAPVLGQRHVHVQRADGRPARTAVVVVRATPVTLLPTDDHSYAAARRRWWAAHPAVAPVLDRPLTPLTVGVVEVEEIDPPDAVTPLHWRLLTSLPLTTVAEIDWVVHCYTLRWLSERFHYVLKQGCAVERLQLEQPDRWKRALVVYSLVAWHVLWLTYLGRVAPELSAEVVVGRAAWQAVGARLTGQVPRESPTLGGFLGQVGKLGGHLGRTRDGPPGLKSLWRGLDRMSELVALWLVIAPDPTTSV
jgi:hypothetical protein